jgi:hypothetical protein
VLGIQVKDIRTIMTPIRNYEDSRKDVLLEHSENVSLTVLGFRLIDLKAARE